jgi:hypothetical protein
MCACGCILVLGLAGALVYCFLHGLWIMAAVVVAVGCLIGWLGAKAMRKSSADGIK